MTTRADRGRTDDHERSGARVRVEIDAPIDDVFARLDDPERYPDFMEGVKRVERDGRRLRWIAEFGEHDHEWDAEIVEHEAPRAIAWRAEPPYPSARFELAALEDGLTEVLATAEFDGHLLGPVEDASGLLQDRMIGDLERLHDLMEDRRGWQPPDQDQA